MTEDLKPCPLCGGAMSVRTGRDWHRLIGEHAEDCQMQDFEPFYPATPQGREALVSGWSRRPPTIPADVGRRAMEALQSVLPWAQEQDAGGPDIGADLAKARAAITELQQYLPAQEQGEKERI
jgi:hypothetical protein